MNLLETIRRVGKKAKPAAHGESVCWVEGARCCGRNYEKSGNKTEQSAKHTETSCVCVCEWSADAKAEASH